MPFTDRCTSDPAAFASGSKTEKKRRVGTIDRPPNKAMQRIGLRPTADRQGVRRTEAFGADAGRTDSTEVVFAYDEQDGLH